MCTFFLGSISFFLSSEILLLKNCILTLTRNMLGLYDNLNISYHLCLLIEYVVLCFYTASSDHPAFDNLTLIISKITDKILNHMLVCKQWLDVIPCCAV